MRKFWLGLVLTVLAVVLIVLLRPALAQDAVPAQVQAMINDYYGASMPVEYLSLPLENGDEAGIALCEGSGVIGFARRQGEWTYILMAYVTDELRQARMERLPGEAAFAFTSADGSARMTYRFDGEAFRLTGWSFPDYRPVRIQGDTLIYGEGDGAFETVLPGGVTDWPYRMEDLPLTPETALALALITEQNVAEMFPGYTLRNYGAYNDGFMASAGYSRIDENGVLHLRQASFEAGQEVQYTDCLPVPLSENLLARLKTEPFDSLISCWETDSSFLTQDAFCREKLPLPDDAVILDNVVQEKSMIALCEVAGTRCLYIWEAAPDGRGYTARCTLPLPADAYLDTFHAGDGVVQFQWAEQNMSASFVRRADGNWMLSWATCYGPSNVIHLSASAFGVTLYDMDGNERRQIGTMKDGDLFSINLAALDGATPVLDPSGWAVVNNPNPADRLHLRALADRESHSKGKFYNGTPVQVLKTRGSWTQVRIGMGDSAREGWMMTKYLAFGKDMDRVQAAFPALFFRDEYAAENRFSGAYQVVGVEEGGSPKQYILLGDDGTVMYVPQHWLWGGNG